MDRLITEATSACNQWKIKVGLFFYFIFLFLKYFEFSHVYSSMFTRAMFQLLVFCSYHAPRIQPMQENGRRSITKVILGWSDFSRKAQSFICNSF
jgi:hypothetical protein